MQHKATISLNAITAQNTPKYNIKTMLKQKRYMSMDVSTEASFSETELFSYAAFPFQYLAYTFNL